MRYFDPETETILKQHGLDGNHAARATYVFNAGLVVHLTSRIARGKVLVRVVLVGTGVAVGDGTGAIYREAYQAALADFLEPKHEPESNRGVIAERPDPADP